MIIYDGENIRFHLIIDFSTIITPSFATSVQVDIDLDGLIYGYINLVKGWLE